MTKRFRSINGRASPAATRAALKQHAVFLDSRRPRALTARSEDRREHNRRTRPGENFHREKNDGGREPKVKTLRRRAALEVGRKKTGGDLRLRP